MLKTIIAIDGYAATGKSTLAKRLADTLNFIHIDTGAMYRAITFFALKKYGQINKLEAEDLKEIKITFQYKKAGKNAIFLNEKNIEKQIINKEVVENVSQLSTFPFVRNFILQQLIKIVKNNNVVMDGRDIGTAVFPNAQYKFFLTADIDIRAQRRYNELKSTPSEISFEKIKQNLIERDKKDISRKIDPLKKATDAIEINTSNKIEKEVLQTVLEKIAIIKP